MRQRLRRWWRCKVWCNGGLPYYMHHSFNAWPPEVQEAYKREYRHCRCWR